MKTNKLQHTFRAFRNRNYALFFAGQSVSQIGTWMQRTAISWLVYSITHSPFMLGLTVFAAQFPSFLLSLVGGIVSDRYNRHRILLFTQTASLLQAFLLALAVLTHHYSIGGILTLSVILGVINAFDVPARQPLVHELVSDKSELPNALALNSAMVNLARLVGPALSGIILQQFGAGICFLLNAISFLAVISSLLLLRLPPYRPSSIKKNAVSELSEGFVYLTHTPVIGTIIAMMALMSIFVFPYDTLLPVFAKTVFRGDARTFGYIYSFIGLGAISGTFFLASLKTGTDLKIVLLINTIILGVALIAFSRIFYFPLAMVFAVCCGFGTMSQSTIGITLVQIHSHAHMRGRMMSYLVMAFFGMLPVGSLLVGWVSQRIGAQDTLLGQGIMALVVIAAFSGFLRKDMLDKRKKPELEEAEELMTAKI
ncbi:MAG TPA: MFS transporter [Puia sp.]|nr:MFS transporter [Puia sp.]